MSQAAYSWEDTGRNEAVAPVDVVAPTVTLFGESDLLPELAADARRAGLRVAGMRPLRGDGEDDDDGSVGDICVIDCRTLGGADLAALIGLDERAARAGAEVVAITSAALLEDAFGCLETARTQFVVDPRPGEHLVALGTALARLPGNRMRELDETDRLTMLRLTQEVGRLAAKLDRMALPLGEEAGDMSARLASPGIGYRGEGEPDRLRKPKVPLPDPRLIHRIIRQRRLRDRYFEPELFADPAWDILLDLTAARAEHRRVSVTSLCIAAAVPATTALRWITQMTEMGLLKREQDPEDRRRAFIVLADPVADAMARYFDELGKDAGRLV